jgi:YVTN family beta-propeller protein
MLAITAFIGAARAEPSGKIYISNEKSSTITVLNGKTNEVIGEFETCARPRGMHFNLDRTRFFVGCADDNIIAVYDTATAKLVHRIRKMEEPETFDLHPGGEYLVVSNEEDAAATKVNVATGKVEAEAEIGEEPEGVLFTADGKTVEPEGVLFTADGKTVYVASEANNLVHVIDFETMEVRADIFVGTRPRRFALTRDEKYLWVSCELAGEVDIIDTATNKVAWDILFQPPGFRREDVTPVDLVITGDGKTAYVALGRANHVGVVDVESRKITDYILVGKRPWGLALTRDEGLLYVANGLSDDISIIDTKTRKVLKSIPVGLIPYGILIDD